MVANKRRDVRSIWTCDAETDPFKRGRIPEPFIWGVYTGDDYHQFTNAEEMLEFLLDKKVIIYAHNGGKFDWHFISRWIPDFEPITIINGRLAKFKIGECEFRDSYNIIPSPLSAYKKDDIDYCIMEKEVRHIPENWEKITTYLKADCVYLHEMVTAFIEDYGLNLTQASAAMKYWSKLTGTPKPTTGPYYYEEMSPYYYGGRVECFAKGTMEIPFNVVDINSAYPFAMTFDHPWGSIYNTLDDLPDYFTDDDISRCFININAEGHGAFPLRTDNGLTFPNDAERHDFAITGWEYLAARDTDTLGIAPVVTEVRQYAEKINFREYVDFFFDMKDRAKKAGDKGRYLFAKLFLNSLYGKFASNPENYEEFMTLPAEFIDAAKEDDGWDFCDLLCDETALVCRPLPEEKRRYYDVAVSASITGFVRAYLWLNILKTKGTVLYCDTDSIAAEIIDGIPLSNILGDWDLEAKCDYAAIAGKKLYAFRKLDGEYKTATKGVRLKPEQVIEIAEGGQVLYEPEAPTFSVKRGIIFTPRKIRMLE